MRLIIDSLIALMLVGILGAVLVHHRHEQQRIEQHRSVHEALSALYEQTLYHSVMDPELGQNLRDPLALNRPLHRFPKALQPGWFDGAPPRNVIAPRHPWVDVAPPGDTFDHPPDPVLRSSDQAGFWYNPERGIFRARVPAQLTADATLELYNRLNNCSLTRLEELADPARVATIPPSMQLKTAPQTRLAADVPADAAAPATRPAAGTPDRRPALLRAAEVSTRP